MTTENLNPHHFTKQTLKAKRFIDNLSPEEVVDDPHLLYLSRFCKCSKTETVFIDCCSGALSLQFQE